MTIDCHGRIVHNVGRSAYGAKWSAERCAYTRTLLRTSDPRGAFVA
jgi:hypothetical protein